MKKDYIPVSETDAILSEEKFIEKQWTQIWETCPCQNPSIPHLKMREEFRIMDPYLSKLPAGSRILDGGCGLGEWTLYYTKRGFEVVGLDISWKTIERLREKFPEVRFQVGDIRKTEFEDRYFDAYFSWGTFEHFEIGLGPCFQEAARILKPGGYLFVSVPFQNGRHLLRDMRELSRWDDLFKKGRGYPSQMRFYQWRLTKSELQREFELNGFECLRVEAIHKWQGLHRAIKHDLHLDTNSYFHKIVQAILYPFIPRSFIAHMLLGVGQKR